MELNNPFAPELNLYLTLLTEIKNKNFLLHLNKNENVILFNPDYVNVKLI